MSEDLRPIKVDTPVREGLCTHEYLIIDKSSSMHIVTDTVIEKVNDYIALVKEVEEKTKVPAFISILLFSDTQAQWLLFAPAKEAMLLSRDSYIPKGMTALNDAIGTAIAQLREELKGKEKETNVTITAFTDGDENSSTTYPEKKNVALAGLIKEVSDTYNWTVALVGAGEVAEVNTAADNIGINLSNTLCYKPGIRETARAFGGMENAMLRKATTYCSTGITGSTCYFMDPNPPEEITLDMLDSAKLQ